MVTGGKFSGSYFDRSKSLFAKEAIAHSREKSRAGGATHSKGAQTFAPLATLLSARVRLFTLSISSEAIVF